MATRGKETTYRSDSVTLTWPAPSDVDWYEMPEPEPGPVVAQVTDDIRDTVSSNYVLIPKGSRLLCEYQSAAARGQSRLVLGCTRLIFPNGQSQVLPDEPAADLDVRAVDVVDAHALLQLVGEAIGQEDPRHVGLDGEPATPACGLGFSSAKAS